VEAGKKAAGTLLGLQRKILACLQATGHPLELAELAEKVGERDQIEQVYKIVRHLAANRRGVVLLGDHGKPDQLSVDYKPC